MTRLYFYTILQEREVGGYMRLAHKMCDPRLYIQEREVGGYMRLAHKMCDPRLYIDW